MKKKCGRIVLVGFKGSGKSSVGKRLAKQCGFAFVDVDAVIEAAHAKGGRKSGVRAIFKKHGREYFLKMEGSALKKTARMRNVVVSLGGASPLNPAFSKALFKNARFAYLKAKRNVLFARIVEKGIPPFFDRENPRRTFNMLYKQRTPVYEKIADIVVENSGARTPGEVAAQIMQRMEGEQ